MLIEIDLHTLREIARSTLDVSELIKHGADDKLKLKFIEHKEMIINLVEIVSEARYKKETDHET